MMPKISEGSSSGRALASFSPGELSEKAEPTADYSGSRMGVGMILDGAF
jgi:hypothetical protein